MNATWMRTRLVLLLTALFLLGALAGHLATRRWADPYPETSRTVLEDSDFEPQSRREMMRATRRVMDNYRAVLKLTDADMENLKPHFAESAMKMGELPGDSPLRLDVLKQFHESIRATLPLGDDQKKALDEILRRAGERR